MADEPMWGESTMGGKRQHLWFRCDGGQYRERYMTPECNHYNWHVLGSVKRNSTKPKCKKCQRFEAKREKA